MRALLERLALEDAGKPDPTLLPPTEGRALAADANARWNRNLLPMAEERNLTLGPDLPARLLVPEIDEERGAILFVHGGGWSFCSKETHERSARLLAIAARAPVVTFDYRLAPEHPFPAGVEDCVAAWRAFAGMMPGRALGIAGDSAGANLAVATLLSESGSHRALPQVALLFYGVYAADFDSPSYVAQADGPGLTRAKMMRYWDWYAPDKAKRADPLLSPQHASDSALRALPPLYLNAAGLDPLRSDTERFFHRLRTLGRTDTFHVFDGVVHGFMQMSEDLPEAREATSLAGAYFREFLPAR